MDAVRPSPLDIESNAVHRTLGWVVPVLLLVACAISLSIDVPVAAFFLNKSLPAFLLAPLIEWLEICEAFGHGFGTTLIIIAIAVLDPLKLRCIPWAFAGSLGAGIMSNLAKLLVVRGRPREFEDLAVRSVWMTFAAEPGTNYGSPSFPSAHTATAVGLAVILTTLYPRGRWYFALLAALVGTQRIVVSAHFPSDVFAGALFGWIVGSVCAASMTATMKTASPSV